MYRYRRRRRAQNYNQEVDDPLERLIAGIAGLFLLSLVGLYFTNRTTFWEVFVGGGLLVIVGVFVVRYIRDSVDRRHREAFQKLLQTMSERGFEAEIQNFITRFGHEKGDARFDYQGYAFTSARLRHLQELAREKQLDLDGKTLFRLLRYYIEEREKKVTFESVGAGHQHTFADLSGSEFEQLLCRLFEAMGYAVQMTGRTGDQGGDLIANKDGRRVLIQAKRWNGSVGNDAVQQAAAAKQYYDCNEAAVIAASAFTSEAQQLAKATGVRLADKQELQELLLKYLKESWV